jgi:uncharacterized protein (TIGR02271 family)
MTLPPSSDPVEMVVPLHEEDISVERHKVERDVRVRVHTVHHDHLIDEALTREQVEVERVAVGRSIDAVPPVREEGDTTVISVVEEILVLERRLVLKEAIRLRRVRRTEQHRETVMLREQQAVIERSEPGGRRLDPLPELAPIAKPQHPRNLMMTDETIVAVYDTAEHAALAVRDLEAAGIPSSAISQHAAGGSVTGSTATTAAAPHREQGFWASLFGGEPEYEHDTTVYNRSLESGSTVVSVKASELHVTQAMEILERHNPINIDERATSYGVSQTAATGTIGAPRVTGTGRPGESEAIPLTEETLAVGKRAVNRGTTRVRRYVVETPVEEQVALRDETVSIERRPVADARPVTNADFTDKVVELTETAEEAVVSKSAQVKEEVVIRKDATERTETVRDTVRREDVEITKEPGSERPSTSTADISPAASTPKI